MTPYQIRACADAQHHDHGEHLQAQLPIYFGKQQRERIHQRVPVLRKRRRFVEFFNLAQLGVQRGHHLRRIQLQQGGVSSDKTPDVNWCREGVEIAFLNSRNVIGADFGGFTDLLDG